MIVDGTPSPIIEMLDTTVVFLARGAEGGRVAADAFLDSYSAKRAGYPHRLLVLMKGWGNDADRAGLAARVKEMSGTILDLPDDGLDLGAYFRAISHVNAKWVCFLNTNSRIIADNWLYFLRQAAEKPGIGAAGASGSWESPYNSALTALGGGSPGVKDLLRLAYYRWLFCPFPNVHLRSNGFLCRSDDFRDYAGRHRFPRSKRDTHLIEAGRRSFSAFLRKRGLGLAVVDAKGQVHAPEAWPQSQTFRVAGHRNLLISDNQTRGFDEADAERQRELQIIAWGRPIAPAFTE